MCIRDRLCMKARKLGREYVISAEGMVGERSSKNPKMPTGDIEIMVENFSILNPSKVPPFTIEDETDGGDELRMKYRYLDLRREPVKENIIHRHRVAQEVRQYLGSQGFIEIETPVLIKSTPEGARDFVVPSRVHPGSFYALPQSPQTFKQLLMISGFDKYFQIVRCFRDEDLRADRQPEFTQIDCEMSFVEQEDVLMAFEGLAVHLLKAVKDYDIESFPRISYQGAMSEYGTDKPDLRFGMKITELSDIVKGSGFKVFDNSGYVGGIVATACSDYSRKELDRLTDFVKRPQIGAKGLVYVKYNIDGSIKSPLDKFFSPDELKTWAAKMAAVPGDLILVLAGERTPTLTALSELRLETVSYTHLTLPTKRIV